MSLFELLLVLFVGFLVLKPDDLPKIAQKIRELNSFFFNSRKEIISYLDLSDEAKELSIDTDRINFYLEKISNMGSEYNGDYSIDSIKEHYNSLVKSKLQAQQNKSF